MIKPSIGRVVHVCRKSLDYTSGVEQPRAAIVTYVHSDTMLNLSIFTPGGDNIGRTSVYLRQPEVKLEDVPDDLYAEWMPFQVGQAAAADTKGITGTGGVADPAKT